MNIQEVRQLDAGWQLDFEIMRLLGYEKQRLRHLWAFYKNGQACFTSRADQDEHYRFNKTIGVGDPPRMLEWSATIENALRLPIPQNMYWELYIVDANCSAYLCDRESDFVYFFDLNEQANLALAIVRAWLYYVAVIVLQGKEG